MEPAIIHKTGKGKADRPKAKETDGAWITTASGYYNNEFVAWAELPAITRKEEKILKTKTAK